MTEQFVRTKSPSISQTLSRGLAVLQLLSNEADGYTAAEIAAKMSLDRAIVYRLLNTLLAQRFIRRQRGRFHLGRTIVNLARSAHADAYAAAIPELSRLADSTGAAASLTVADGIEGVALFTIQPQRDGAYVSYLPGFRHLLTVSASGLAILAGHPPKRGERSEITIARKRGYAITANELALGAIGIAAPLVVGSRPVEASIAVISMGTLDQRSVAPVVIKSARLIEERIVERH